MSLERLFWRLVCYTRLSFFISCSSRYSYLIFLNSLQHSFHCEANQIKCVIEGCAEIISRKQLNHHLQTSVDKHVLLLNEQVKQLKRRLETVEEQQNAYSLQYVDLEKMGPPLKKQATSSQNVTLNFQQLLATNSTVDGVFNQSVVGSDNGNDTDSEEHIEFNLRDNKTLNQ